MNHDEAAKLAKRIAGLWPSVTPEQAKQLACDFQQDAYDAATCGEIVTSMFGTELYFSLPVLNGRIDRRRDDRRQAQLEESKAHDRIVAGNDRVAHEVNLLDDATLARLKSEVLATMKPEARALLEKRDPRRSLALQLSIFDYVHRRYGKPLIQLGARQALPEPAEVSR